ncbi:MULTISPECIES: hypothetical protein [Acinetobacter]|uniref:hypothetical protein n=1 Tax=Acinetobacter indicus TaxID=756892 RepID=UPI0015D447D4|nr:hypothetical protein [Acinetobacter indicus]UNW09707.1 hypothetical protein MOW14_00530 [Acinetobacter indicus]
MNGYSYLEDTQELKLEPFRDFYQALAEAKLKNDQDFFKLNDFIQPTEVVKLIKIMTQHPTDLSISKYPLAHYLLALINTPSAYQSNALKWAIFNTQCIELLNGKEHTATVANLCRRFRLASTKKEYYWLYNFLPSLPIELEELVKFLKNTETENGELFDKSKESLEKTEMGQLAEIRVIYTYAHTQSERQKRNRQSNPPPQKPSQTDVKKTLRISLDGEKTYQTHFERGVAKQPPEDKTIEKVEDHNFEFNSLEQCSITAQINNLKNKILHQNKNELMSKPNPRVFDLPTAQYIMQILLEQAENSPIHTLLLFSVLSLTHYKDLPVFQKNLRVSTKNKEVSLQPQKCFFKQSFEVSKFKDFVLRKHRLNTVNSFTIPLPQYYLENLSQLKKMDGVEIDFKIQEYLRKINKGLTFQLTSQNLPRLLSDIALNEMGYELESKLLNGESVQHYIPCHYFSKQIVDIFDIYTQTLILTVPQLETEYLEEFSNPHSFGSQQTPNLPFVQSFFYQLDHQVRNNPNPFQTLNHYSIWLWHICMLITSARPSESFPPNLDYIDLDNQLMAVADKEQRYSGTIGRYLPFNNFLRDEIQHYLKYLKHFLHLTKAYLSQEQVQAIQEVFEGERPFLLFYDPQGYIRNLELSDIQKYCTEIALQRNWTRHFARYFFAQYCNEDLIKGIFDHDEAMQELFDRYSAFQATDYDQIRTAQDKLVEILELKSMSSFTGIMIT